MEYKDYYNILGVTKTADEKEIKRAYRNLALNYHPDKNPNNQQAEEKFKEINEAYEVLGNPENRRKYDRLGANYHRFQQMGGNPYDFDFSQWFSQGAPGGSGYRTQQVNLNDLFGEGGGSFSDFFQSIFGGGFDARAGSTGTIGASLDVEQPVQITLEEAYQGATRTFEQNGRRFTAKIPPGAREGNKIRLRGKGNQGRHGRGDLYLVVQLQDHPQFTVEGDNLKTTVAVDVVTAVLGGKVTVETMTGPVHLTIPPGTQGGQTFRLKDKGLPRLKKEKGQGDLYAQIKIRIPTQLSAEQQQLYKQLGALNETPPEI